MKTAIIVHGGAGAWSLKKADLQAAQKACVAAAQAGQRVLLAGGSALDAVETAVNILEDCPVLDAGKGSYPNQKGEVEMDALIMDGRTLNLGAVAAVRRVRHPISLARQVMEQSEHNLLVGDGAEAYADKIGFPRCDVADLLVTPAAEPAHTLGDTVGAAAIDSQGDLAAATSTGGTKNKMAGRVGDSPLVGSGGYADNLTAAVSATGHGESLMKIVISKTACDCVAKGMNAQEACDAAIGMLAERVQGRGGLIAVDRQGQVGFAYNTDAMPHAFAIGEEKVGYGQ